MRLPGFLSAGATAPGPSPSLSDVLPNPFALVKSRRFAKRVIKTYAKRSSYYEPALRYLRAHPPRRPG